MLEALRQFYPPVPITRNIPQWNMFTQQVHNKQVMLTDRYRNLSIPPVTGGLKVLERILRIAEPKWMAGRYDNFYILTTQIPWIMNDCKSVFAFSQGGKTYKNLFAFAANSRAISEYVIPPDDNDWLKYLPVHLKDYSAWMPLQPLTLWWHDSIEQTFDLFSSGYLRFHADAPSFVYWILDIPTLVMKAVQYFRVNADIPLTRYIQTEVLSHLTDQMESTWYFMLHKSAVKIALGELSLSEVIDHYRQRQTQYSYVGTKLDEAMRDILNIYEDIKKGALKALPVLSVPFFRGKSFVDLATAIPLKYNLSHMSQYQAMRLLRDIPLLDYLVNMYRLNPGDHMSSQFRERFRVLLFKWKANIPLSMIKIEAQRIWIKRHLDAWTEFCMTR